MEAIMHTNLGDIRLELFEDKAPITVTNFVEPGSTRPPAKRPSVLFTTASPSTA